MVKNQLENQLIELVKASSPYMNAKPITYSDLVFEERVLLNCFYCQRSGVNWKCPPNIPDMDYKKALQELDSLLLVWCKIPLEKKITDHMRRESTNLLHRTLLKAEKLLWENNYPLAVSFIGGSCKLCAHGCDPERCRQSHIARIPFEAIGVNVVKTTKNLDINIIFPPRDHMYRVGLIGW